MDFDKLYNRIIKETTSNDEKDLEKEIAMGKEVEKEHKVKTKKAEEIAKQHLEEDPKYYTKLKKAGL